MEYKVHQSDLKNWEDPSICKLKLYHQRIKKTIPQDPPSEQMIKGIYFETKALGENGRGYELPDISFLYDSKGRERVELTRINEQVSRFKELFDPSHDDFLGLHIKDTQVFLQSHDSEGTIDFTAIDDFGRDAIVDLKFTADVDSDFGDYAWGREPEDIDWTQMKLYKRLYRENFGVDPLVYTIVFDASPRKGIRLFQIKISDTSESIVSDRVEIMYHEVKSYIEDEGLIPANPSIKNCDGCLVSDCILRFKPGVIKKTIINL